MTSVVVLDAGPLGFAVHPQPPPHFRVWLEELLVSPIQIVIPEIADFEVRRSLIRIGSYVSIETLDRLGQTTTYAPITTPIMRRAAQLWADARRQGRPTAPDAALDADVILAATALELVGSGEDPLVITTNVAHLGRYVAATTWEAHSGRPSSES